MGPSKDYGRPKKSTKFNACDTYVINIREEVAQTTTKISLTIHKRIKFYKLNLSHEYLTVLVEEGKKT
jgi:hypothetical protein